MSFVCCFRHIHRLIQFDLIIARYAWIFKRYLLTEFRQIFLVARQSEKIKQNRFIEVELIVELYGLYYSGVSNNHTLCVYLFPRKILPCAFISPLLNSTMDTLCVYCFSKNILPCAPIPYCAIIRYSRVTTLSFKIWNTY